MASDFSFQHSTGQSVYFVNASLPDVQTLLAGLPAGAEVHLIPAGVDGVEWLASVLSGRTGVAAVHVLTHGSAGSLNLGSTILTSDNLDEYAPQWAAVQSALTEQADFLIYGCNVGEGPVGASFVHQLAAWTGADVAASTDLTGASTLGGDWSLELVTGAIDAEALEAQSYAGVLAAPVIAGLDPSTFTEGGPASVIDSSISFSGGSNYGGGYVEYRITGAVAGDQLTLQSGNGITVSGANVFSNGTFIGSIDSTYNGQNGQALRINFQSNFTNPGFEAAGGGGGVTGWTIGTSRVILGQTSINGHVTPSDITIPPNAGGDADPATMTYSSELSTTEKTEGTTSLRLYNSGNTQNGYDVVHGPYAYSNTFTSAANDVLYFDWRAAAGGDAFDVFAYLMKSDGSQSVVVLNETGANDSGVTNWATASVTVPTSGDWYFVFVAGTYDFTGGKAVGGSLYIDNFKVFGNTVNDSVASSLATQIAYQNIADDAPAGARTLTVTAADGSGATSSATSTVTVVGANNAPSFSAGAALSAVNEDAAPVGATVSALFGALYSDPDTAFTPADSLAGIAIVGDASNSGQGVWQYSTDSGSNWYSVGSVSASDALVLSISTLVRFVPNANWNGTPGSLSVHAVDSTWSGGFSSGAARTTFDTTTDDSRSPVSVSAVALSTSVTSVNDAPTFTSAAVTLSYADTGALDTFAAPDSGSATGTLAAQDTHGGAPNENGTLTFGVSGGTVSAGSSSLTGTYGTLSVNTSTGAYTFTPNASAINALSAGATATPTYTLTVSDGQGGSATQTLTVNLSGANDAPGGTNGTVTLLEDNTGTAITAAQFGFTDPIDGADDAMLAVKVTTLPLKGSLTLDGVAVLAGDVIAVADINANKLIYTPVADENGAAYDSFTFQVQDNGGTANGGVDLDPTANTLTINITPVNDAPVLQNPGDSEPAATTITEDNTGNSGNLISTLIRAVDGASPENNGLSVVTDADFATQGSAGGAPNEGWDGGVAIYGLTNNGPADGGKWQYKVGSGSWTDVGMVSASSALLLTSSDSIRFLPDTLNGTTATFSYYIWDGSSGAAGSKVDASTRGGTTAFSTDGDEAVIAVTHVNDAPTLDLDASAGGTGFTTIFRPRGDAVAVVDGDVTILDADKLAVDNVDYITGATVSISGGAVDNLFGTTFETLSFKTGGADGTPATSYSGSQGAITITGNGTTALTLAGKGTWLDYQNALKSVFYFNANPNAATGDRTVTIAVTDGALTVGEGAGDRLTSLSAVTTIQTPWTTVVDLNGAADGRNFATTYTEDGPSVAVSASTASLDNQAVNIKTVTLELGAAPDGVQEKLFVSDALVTFLLTRGITVQSNNSHSVTLIASNSVVGYSGSAFGAANSGVSAENMQLALRAVQYINADQDPDVTNREVNVSVVDVGNTGVGAKTLINVVAVNDAPVKGGDFAATLNEGAVYTFTIGDLNSTDADNSTAQLKYVLTALPAQGTLFRDANNNGLVDDGESIATVGDSSSVDQINAIGAGGYFTQAEVAAGLIKYAHNGQNPDGTNPTGTVSLEFKLVDGMQDYAFSNIATNQSGAFALTVNEVNDVATGTPTLGGNAVRGQVLTVDVSGIVDADGPSTPTFTFQWEVSADGGNTWTSIVGATNDSYTLAASEVGKLVRATVQFTDALLRSEGPIRTAPSASISDDLAGPVFESATVTGNSLVVTYADANPLDAVGSPALDAFAVTVGGVSVTPTAITINPATKKVTLTLPNSVAAGQVVALSYTDPSGANDASALQDSLGNDASSLSNASVTNLTAPPPPPPDDGGSFPSPPPAPAPTPIRDDGDGVSTAVELSVPSLSVPGSTAGDGNGDGVSDALQKEVSSAGFRDTPAISTQPNAPVIFVTLVGGSEQGKPEDPGVTLTQFRQLDAPTELPPALETPLGLVSFTATVIDVGQATPFSLYVDPEVGVNGYWRQDASGTWVNLASEAYGGRVVEEGGQLRLDFVIQDGGAFDADGAANGVISAPGVLGSMPLSLTEHHPVVSNDGFWF